MVNQNWVQALRDFVEATSTGAAGKKLGISKATISQVLNDKYPGNMERIQRLVEGALLNQTIVCPILGEIATNECEFHQKRDFAATNPQRTKLWRACRSGCPNSHLSERVGQPINIHIVDNKPTMTNQSEIYNLARQLEYIKNLAAGDKDKLTELLERELTRLATRHNQMIWNKKQVRKSHHE